MEGGIASATSNTPGKGLLRRKGGPKVRSACITCKIRRVKCDETHPSCTRCLNYWGHCEGYIGTGNKLLHAGRPSSKARPSLPQNNQNSNPIGGKGHPLGQSILRQPYTGPAFDSIEEYDSFQTYLQSTSSALSGAFEGPTWVYILPQHASTEPFVRVGLAALGSMTTVFLEVMAQRMNGVPAEEEGHCLGNSPAYSRTLSLYAKSLRHMRVTLSKPSHTLRDTMLACLLVVCFEDFHGHSYTSMLHAQNGLKLFYSWLGRELGSTFTKSPLHSPNRVDLENDLVHSLLRLDIQVLSFFDTRSSNYHMKIAQYGDTFLRHMPSSFLSLDQARIYWDLISHRTCHFLVSCLSAAGATSLALMLNGPTEPYPTEVSLPNGIKLFAQGPIILEDDHTADRAKYTADIAGWERVFAPLQKQLLLSQQARGASILSIHAKMVFILLSGAFFQSEMEYDHLTPIFRSIVTLATSIWSTHTIAATAGVSYNFDLGIIPALFLVGTRCRDRAVRREAISLLLTDFHRENAWDSFSTALISRWIMGMEEDQVSRDQTTPEVEWIYGQRGIESPRAVQKPSSHDAVEPPSHHFQNHHSPEKTHGMSQNTAEAKAFCARLKWEEHPIPEATRLRITRFNIDLNMRHAQVEYIQGRLGVRVETERKRHVVVW